MSYSPFSPTATVDPFDFSLPNSSFAAPVGFTHPGGGFGATVTASGGNGSPGSSSVSESAPNAGARGVLDTKSPQPASGGGSSSLPGGTVSGDPPPLRVVPEPPDFVPPPRIEDRDLRPLPVVPEPETAPQPEPVLDRAVEDRAAEEAQIAADAADARRRRLALIRERQNPTGPRGLLTRPLVQRPRLLGH